MGSKSTIPVHATLAHLASVPMPGVEVSFEDGHDAGDAWSRAVLLTNRRGANVVITLCATGPQAEFEVIDADTGAQLFWRHIESCTVSQIELAWSAMLAHVLSG